MGDFIKYANKLWEDPKIKGVNHYIISKDQLQTGHYYLGKCRNAHVARWDGKKFWYWRTKWGSRFIESIMHPEDDDGYDLFIVNEWLCDETGNIEIPYKVAEVTPDMV